MWFIALLAILVTAGVLVLVIGSMLPREHHVSRRAHFNRSPAEIWEVITDYAGQTEWRADVRRVERLPDRLVLQAHGTFQNHAVIGANGLVSLELAPTLRTLTHAVMLSGSDERINRRPGGALASPGH